MESIGMQIDYEKISVIIAEDEMPVAQLIEAFLYDFSEVQVLNTTVNGIETIEEAKKLRPAAIFLDVEMPLIDGLAVAQQLIIEMPQILIVFVTSYSHYAADAFQLGAVDYIVKPITQEALARSISKIKKQLQLNRTIGNGGLKNNSHRLVLSYKHEVHLIDPEDIIFIERIDRICSVHTVNGTITTSESLNALQSKLNNTFFRCHKSFIINISKVYKIQQIGERIYAIHFHNYSKTAFMTGKHLSTFFALVGSYFSTA